jgi:hypothetical protein
MMPPWLSVRGLGLWMPGFPTVESWRERRRVAEAEAPEPRLPARLRRRTSLLVRMVADVAGQACQQAGVSLAGLPVVVGSAFGELGTTMEMLDELETSREVSPFRFHNSVHNTAVGYLSIAHENRAPCTSLAGGDDTAAMVLQEATALLAFRGGDVLVVVADEVLPEAIGGRGTVPFAAAAVLRAAGSAEPDPRGRLAWAGDLRQVHAAASPLERGVGDPSPGQRFLHFVAAVADASQRGLTGRVELTAGGESRWSIAVAPAPPS